MKRLGVKKALITLVSAAVLFGGYKAYRAWEIAHRPEPAVAWVEERAEPKFIKFLRKHEPKTGPLSNIVPYHSGRLMACDISGKIKWVVFDKAPSMPLFNQYSVPGWAFINDAYELPIYQMVTAMSGGVPVSTENQFTVNMKTGIKTEIRMSTPSFLTVGANPDKEKPMPWMSIMPPLSRPLGDSTAQVVTAAFGMSEFPALINPGNFDILLLDFDDLNNFLAAHPKVKWMWGFANTLMISYKAYAPAPSGAGNTINTSCIAVFDIKKKKLTSIFSIVLVSTSSGKMPVAVPAYSLESWQDLSRAIGESTGNLRKIAPSEVELVEGELKLVAQPYFNRGSVFQVYSKPGGMRSFSNAYHAYVEIDIPSLKTQGLDYPQEISSSISNAPGWHVSYSLQDRNTGNQYLLLRSPSSNTMLLYSLSPNRRWRLIKTFPFKTRMEFVISEGGTLWFVKTFSFPKTGHKAPDEIFRLEPSTGKMKIIATAYSISGFSGEYPNKLLSKSGN